MKMPAWVPPTARPLRCLVCSHCYQRRLRAREAASGAAAAAQLQLAAQMVPKPVLPQAASMEGRARECPVRLYEQISQKP